MKNGHIVAVIGGACAGSEAAFQLSSQNIEVVVFEQNVLPYGKIEDGLPRWHGKLQDKEKKKIDEKLTLPGVHFVPHAKIGKNVTVNELFEQGFSAVILANGAWRDRPLVAKGVDEVKDLSFCYQNPFIYWFNHYHEKSYEGPAYPVTEGAVIVGGGLASIDVVKVCQLEVACQRLKEMGVNVDPVTLEHRGIPRFMEENNLALEDLKMKPAKLFYRKRVSDMPVASPPENCTPERMQKVYQVREKLVNNAIKKYLFEVEPLRVIKEIHSENGSVTGVTFQKTRYEEGKLATTDEEIHVPTSFVVSSIGSIPEPIEGIGMDGEVYRISDTTTGRVLDHESMYGVGNAVTGKGNIQVSYRHSKYMSSFVAGSLNATEPDYESLFKGQKEAVQSNMREIFQYLSERPVPNDEVRNGLTSWIKDQQDKQNYQDYLTWRDQILSAR